LNRTDAVIGVDIGGTNTVFGLVDRAGKVHHRQQLPTKCYPKPRELFSEILDTILLRNRSSEDPFNIKGIGIGAPNANYYSKSIEDPPNLPWGVVDVAGIVRSLVDIPLALTNDANAAALGEMRFGAARGMKNFVEITLGTGLGSGIVINGELVYGHDGYAGEIGHTVVDIHGRQCRCGKKGCLETYCSATGLCRTVHELLCNETAPSALRHIPFADLTSKKVFDAASDGDAIAKMAFAKTGRILGQALADTAAHLSPEAIILSGGLAMAGEMILHPVREHFEKSIFHLFRGHVEIIPSRLPADDSAILGAGALVWHEMPNAE
jgi:glucokinase